MAGAEARAVWQRTVNRCFVQEDAKRAPKFTCHQSSSSSSIKQVEEDSRSSRPPVDPQNQSSSSSCAGLMPLHRNPNFPDLVPPNTRLWNHHHVHHGHHIHIQPNQKEQVKEKSLEAEVNISISDEKKPSFSSESFQEFIDLMEKRESYGSDESSNKLNEVTFDPSSPWNPLSSEKVGPWWRTTDKDELASLVAQRSLEFVENCDLPTPQKLKRSFGSPQRRFGSDYSVSNQTIHEHGPSKNRTDADSSDLSKSELLEALRRSQTRAREAEKMAKEAYAEKEHLVKILFKQASELFGYKQWLQLLQLEALYFQIKNKKKKKEETPGVASSIPWSKPERRKRRSKSAKPVCAVGLLLGMSLVGAGLLLGWTVGWMQMFSF